MTPSITRVPAPARAAGGTSVTRGLLDVLRAWGVRRLYCCPGSTEAAVLDALVTRHDIELVLVTHESVAVAMAEGEARVTGRPAVAYLHTNVGMANGLAHLSSAQLSGAPVVVLNGLKAAPLSGRGGFTSIAHPRDMVRQHVKWAQTCVTADRVVDDVDRALHTATMEPAGPVWLGLPQDLLESDDPRPGRPADGVPPVGRTGSSGLTRPDAAAVARATQLLAEAERPVLVAGGDVVRRGAVDAVATLAERLGAPVFDEGRRDFLASAVPTTHPLHAGLYDPAHPAVRDADAVAFLGCRLFTEFEAADVAAFPPVARVVHLHTDPGEVGRLHPVDASLVGDPALALADLLDHLPHRPPPTRSANRPAQPGGPVNGPARPAGRIPGHAGLGPVVAALAHALDEPAPTVVLDATTATVPLLRGLRTCRPGQLLSSTSGSLGWGMGAALGVALAAPEHRVVAVLGDGAFQFGLPALWTAARSAAPVLYVVLDNTVYGAVASALHRFGGAAVASGDWPGTDVAGLDIAAAAQAFGVPATRVSGAAGLTEAVAEALTRPGPALVVVDTAPRPAERAVVVDPAAVSSGGGGSR